MSSSKIMTMFFSRVKKNYSEGLQSVKKILEDGMYKDSSDLEIQFILTLINKLNLDSQTNTKLTALILEELLKGGHMTFTDNGTFYHELVNHFEPLMSKRKSSHHSSEQQYSLSGPVVKEVLIGVSEDKNGNKTTWIQFERHNLKTIKDFILHMVDYLIHKATKKNVGPYGLSHYTDKNPLIINPGNYNKAAPQPDVAPEPDTSSQTISFK